ncbi:MAG: hypothetical protein AAF752_00045 [Bacteroidota bacterium]
MDNRKCAAGLAFLLALMLPALASAQVLPKIGLSFGPSASTSGHEIGALAPQAHVAGRPAVVNQLTALLQIEGGHGPVLDDEPITGCQFQNPSNDKYKHLALSFAGTVVTHYALEKGLGLPKAASFLIAATAVTAAGVLKEVSDRNDPLKQCFDPNDILANTGGILAGGALVFSF